MLLLPLSHEHGTARRLPWVTVAIIAANLVVHALTAQSGERALLRFQEKLEQAVEVLGEQPDLELRPPLSEIITPELRQRIREEKARGGSPPEGVPVHGVPMLRVLDELTRDPGGAPDLTPATDEELEERRSRAQRDLDLIARELGRIRTEVPAQAYGYIPAHGEISTLFTYQFLHGGYLHLLGNLWFLWLVGCNVEDVWGRRVFAGFYLAGGIAAAPLHHFFSGDSAAPLIGASGAVAAAMGAFLVQRSSAKIRFLFLMFIRPWFFSAPAWFVLPLYLVLELA
ncbi:MAG: rhomboid family intramembrane serine protease, partial [Deltaproteobacteria bacterium]|nr:rhomboid family intramembrane serine protease [Deltaproteobacteria bacterium]